MLTKIDKAKRMHLFAFTAVATLGLATLGLVALPARGAPIAPRQPLSTGPAQAADQAAEVDLLETVDLQRDAAAGEWTVNRSAMESTGGRAILSFPVKLPKNYRWTVVLERLKGTDGINLVVVVGNQQTMIVLEGFGKLQASGLNLLRGRSADRNKTTRRGPIFHAATPMTVVCTVRGPTIHVSCDGKEIFNWSGAPEDLSLDRRYWAKVPADQLAVAIYESNVLWRVSKSVLEELEEDSVAPSSALAESAAAATGPSMADNSAKPTQPDRNPPDPVDEREREKLFIQKLKADALKSVDKQVTWTTRKIGETEDSFTAILLNKGGDWYHMRDQRGYFLVHTTDLSEASQAEAKQIYRDLTMHYMTDDGNVQWKKSPKINHFLWLDTDGKIVGPAKPLELADDGNLTYEDLQQEKQQIRKDRLSLTDATRVDLDRLLGRAARTSDPNAMVLSGVKMAGTRMFYACNFVATDGDDVIVHEADGRKFRIYRFALDPESLERFIANAAKQDRSNLIKDNVPNEQVTLRLLRTKNGGFVGPATPISVSNGLYVAQRPTFVTVQVNVDKLVKQDYWEVRSELHRRSTGKERNPRFDELFKQQMEEVTELADIPKLDEQKQAVLDQLTTPTELRWKTETLPVDADESIVAVNNDGSRLVVKNRRLEVLDVASKKRFALPFPPQNQPPLVFFAVDGLSVWGHDGKALSCWDYEQQKAIATLPRVTGKLIAGRMSVNGQRLVLLNAEGHLFVVTLDDHQVGGGQLDAEIKSWEGSQLVALSDGLTIGLLQRDRTFSAYRYDPANDLLTQVMKDDFPGDFLSVAMLRDGVLAMPPQGVLAVEKPFDPREVRAAFYLPGFVPRSIQLIDIDGEGYIQFVGPHVDARFPDEKYDFAVQLSMWSGRPYSPAQTLDSPMDSEPIASLTGEVLVHPMNGKWMLERRPTLVTRFEMHLAKITSQLIEENAPGQAEAMFQYLRAGKFDALGDYPDEVCDLFVDHLESQAMKIGLEHGGDVESRAEMLLQNWTKRLPKGQLMPLLNAVYQRNRAWEARGSGYADTVTEEGFREFRQRMEEAEKLLKPVLESADPPSRAVSLAFDIAKGLSPTKETLRDLFAKMIGTRASTNLRVNEEITLMLMPRWFGEPGQCETYMTAAADRVDGVAGNILYTQLVAFVGQFQGLNNDLSKKMTIDWERAYTGLEAYYEKKTDPDLLERMLRIYAADSQWEQCRKALDLRTKRRIRLAPTTAANLSSLQKIETQTNWKLSVGEDDQ